MGFNRENVVQFDIDFVNRMDSKQRTALYQELLLRLEALPGVQAASLYGFGLLSGNGWSDRVLAEGYVATPDEDLTCQGMWVGPKFFETLGTKILSGRDFARQDDRTASVTNAAAPQAAVINEAMARRYFGAETPLGRRVYFASRPERKFEIIGVVKDAKYESLREEPQPAAYYPYTQRIGYYYDFEVRYSGDPQASISEVRRAVGEVDRSLPITYGNTLAQQVERSITSQALVAQLSTFFGLLAVFLACIGIYGLMSYAVSRRTNEIGVRLALGARRSSLLWMVMRESLTLVMIGLVAGLGAALAATRVVASQLYGLKPHDPTTVAVAMCLLLAVAALASFVPARRASQVDPMAALRYE